MLAGHAPTKPSTRPSSTLFSSMEAVSWYRPPFPLRVIAGLVPAIHEHSRLRPFWQRWSWMPGTSPGMTSEGVARLKTKARPRCTGHQWNTSGNDLGVRRESTNLSIVIPEFAPANIRDRGTRTHRGRLGRKAGAPRSRLGLTAVRDDEGRVTPVITDTTEPIQYGRPQAISL